MHDNSERPTTQPNLLIDGVHPYDDPALKKKENVSLEELIKKEMASQGLNPINIDEIREFWASKGVING